MCKAEIWTQSGCLWILNANRVWGRPVTWPEFYRQQMGKKSTSLKWYISITTNIDEKWFVVFEHTINHLTFGYVRLPPLENFFFSCFAPFFLLFFLFLLPSFALKVSGRDIGLKAGLSRQKRDVILHNNVTSTNSKQCKEHGNGESWYLAQNFRRNIGFYLQQYNKLFYCTSKLQTFVRSLFPTTSKIDKQDRASQGGGQRKKIKGMLFLIQSTIHS